MRSTRTTLLLCAIASGCSGQIATGGSILVETEKNKSSGVTTDDPTGTASTSSVQPLDLTNANDFFHDFGTNGRTCGTCHKVDQGWSFTPAAASTLPSSDPLFVFDGSDCLPPGVPNPNPNTSSQRLMRNGLIRVEVDLPSGADYTLVEAHDQLCGAPAAPTLRMYRRPLPSANSRFLTTFMWDGREASLEHQAMDATFGHARSTTGLPAGPAAIVSFETNTFVGQLVTGSSPPIKLDFKGGLGGSDYLMNSVPFKLGMNDPLDPAHFSPVVFTLYQAWEPGGTPPHPFAAAIGRGEAIFNSRTFNIPGVRGLPPTLTTATCGTCHNTPNVGNHSSPLAIDIGVTSPNPPGLDVSLLPTYTFRRNTTGETITVTDPGRGLVSGKFDDLGKTKGPVLRGLAARAPYFHNGSAADLGAVLDFYSARFGLGLTAGERADLIAFLGSL